MCKRAAQVKFTFLKQFTVHMLFDNLSPKRGHPIYRAITVTINVLKEIGD